MTLRLLSLADADLPGGFRFYELQEQGLGSYFPDSLYSDIESLRLYAGIHRHIFGYHRLLSKRFPFAIYYDFLAFRYKDVMMRTTLDIDAALLEAARSLAVDSHKSIGAVISDLALRGLRRGATSAEPASGLPVFAVRSDAPPLDPKRIRELIEFDDVSCSHCPG